MADRITFAEQFAIDDFEALATEFFDELLHLDYSACFVSDDSLLSHFAGGGLPPGALPDDADFEALNAIWDRHILAEIAQRYGVALDSTGLRLVDLFNRIEQHRRQRVH